MIKEEEEEGRVTALRALVPSAHVVLVLSAPKIAALLCQRTYWASP